MQQVTIIVSGDNFALFSNKRRYSVDKKQPNPSMARSGFGRPSQKQIADLLYGALFRPRQSLSVEFGSHFLCRAKNTKKRVFEAICLRCYVALRACTAAVVRTVKWL